MKRDKSLTNCEYCGEFYAFIQCRVTKANGVNWCLLCCSAEERGVLHTRPKISPVEKEASETVVQ